MWESYCLHNLIIITDATVLPISFVPSGTLGQYSTEHFHPSLSGSATHIFVPELPILFSLRASHRFGLAHLGLSPVNQCLPGLENLLWFLFQLADHEVSDTNSFCRRGLSAKFLHAGCEHFVMINLAKGLISEILNSDIISRFSLSRHWKKKSKPFHEWSQEIDMV